MVSEELLRYDDEENDDDEINVIEDDDNDEEEHDEDRHNWSSFELNDRDVAIRRARMNQLRMYERAHSMMRLMFARLEDNENAEPEDVDFQDYSTIASDNYSFDDFTESDGGSENDGGNRENDNDDEFARVIANRLPPVGRITYYLERADYDMDDFVRIILHNEHPQYSSIIESRRTQSIHRNITRIINRVISRYQNHFHPHNSQVNTVETSISEINHNETSIDQTTCHAQTGM
jgi:hypothetical protein